MNTRDIASLATVPAYEALATAIHVGADKCEQEGHPLNQIQQISMLMCAIQCADGLAEEIRSTFRFDALMDQMRDKPGGGE